MTKQSKHNRDGGSNTLLGYESIKEIYDYTF